MCECECVWKQASKTIEEPPLHQCSKKKIQTSILASVNRVEISGVERRVVWALVAAANHCHTVQCRPHSSPTTSIYKNLKHQQCSKERKKKGSVPSPMEIIKSPLSLLLLRLMPSRHQVAFAALAQLGACSTSVLMTSSSSTQLDSVNMTIFKLPGLSAVPASVYNTE